MSTYISSQSNVPKIPGNFTATKKPGTFHLQTPRIPLSRIRVFDVLEPHVGVVLPGRDGLWNASEGNKTNTNQNEHGTGEM